MQPSNFVYFFTASGFFIGTIFTILNFTNPFYILLYIASITLFFYLIIHLIIIGFVDIQKMSIVLFNKQDYEKSCDYFINALNKKEQNIKTLVSAYQTTKSTKDVKPI